MTITVFVIVVGLTWVKKNFKMKKYEIHLMGSMNLFAKDEDHALQIAEEQIKVTHPKFNIEVSNVKGKTNGN